MVLVVTEGSFSQEVLDSPIPVLVSFWAPWCGLCRLVNPLLDRQESEWGSPVKVVSINADENFKLANTYRLKTLPTILLIKNGAILSRFDDFKGRDDLRAAAETIQVTLGALQSRYREAAQRV
ncbi:MAG TPA: thioredoxin domain-containing protein [Chroococcidiopsis sp.]